MEIDSSGDIFPGTSGTPLKISLFLFPIPFLYPLTPYLPSLDHPPLPLPWREPDPLEGDECLVKGGGGGIGRGRGYRGKLT